ncbi:uncharacterized protein [Nicotiana sylvestris]|uniref:uncharacterized protein n=1 Tax=Nicotiana sylvestris TaxID=4096 RepID=UPI00388C71B2
MIIAGFTGQLRGWWDNYLSVEEKAFVINATAVDEGVDNIGMALVKGREDVVYTLIHTILEHFNGRFTSNHETIRTLLNGLRCKTLSEFRWYKDTFMSRVMELSENKYEHWKVKFINGLPSLFAERVVTDHKWYIKCTSLIDNTFSLTDVAMIDSGADLYPLIILGTPFINAIYPFNNIDAQGFYATYQDREISYSFVTDPVTRDINALTNMKQMHVNSLQSEILSMNIFDTLQSAKVQQKNKLIAKQMAVDVCADHPSSFWNRKRHIVTLPFEENFSEDDIPTKSRPYQMNAELVEFCKNEIDNLL